MGLKIKATKTNAMTNLILILRFQINDKRTEKTILNMTSTYVETTILKANIPIYLNRKVFDHQRNQSMW